MSRTQCKSWRREAEKAGVSKGEGRREEEEEEEV